MDKIKRSVFSVCTAAVMMFGFSGTMPLSVTASEAIFHAEAENCTVTSGGTITNKVYNDEFPNYSGDGFVWVGGSGGVKFDVDLKEGAMYEISSRCWTYIGDIGSTRLQTIAIDGEVSSNSYYIPNKGEWMDFSFGYHYLPAGKHTIEIGASGGWGYILYDTVTFDYAVMPDLNISPVTCDTKATSETKALMTYLTKQYGNHILSGQQEIYGGGNDGNSELEFEYIYDNTGKYPAIRAFDLMNYNPLYGWEDGTTGRMLQWVTQRGGIISSSWHINVPIDFANYEVGDVVDWQKCTYKNYQTSGSSFNTANILKEDSKERAYWDAAVKMLAEQLLILQDANVPLIFRPLHEAQGNYGRYGDGTSWFWWGDRGPDIYKELWKLLYTTLTETYGVHNCIWEINLYELENSFEWYPGDAYVDMVAYDKYEGSPYRWGTDPATSVFLTLVNDTDDSKMVSIAECDRIPAVAGMVNEGAWWSYFCPWYGEYLMSESNNMLSDLKETYNSEYVITLDELPKDLYGYERGNGGKWDVDGAYECEDGIITRNDGTNIMDYKYCSGNGYVFLKGANDAIEQKVTVDKAGVYSLVYGYQQNYEKAGKTQTLVVNGKEIGDAFFPFNIMFGESEPIQVELQAGENTIKLVSVEGWTYFDYLLVKSASDTPIVSTTTTPKIQVSLSGDADCNGKVSIADAVLLSRYVGEDAVSVSAIGLANAELTGDSVLSWDDVSMILKIIARLV